ncbi:MAG: family 43 glycosylhydrolase [Candidatus Pseudobacter hemicellulosilyticus]|uniref:Family 43 glycosylhydrolase n=1 Tax=Candidatus Pseudobacter hemicellulosilyticus TaxID=3121375 RepID=A0AAJ6BHS4_9BACT|nr:MAG: family 43 glycosylhydrolase [Pseudobacter sp.]
MKQTIIALVLAFLCLPLIAQPGPGRKNKQSLSFTNPLFPGDYPDPSILVDSNGYYIVHSSFDYYPGLTIWHSKDLLNWTPVISPLTRYVGSVWAPDLVRHNNKYYIYFPANNTNYVIVADAINGPWSEPVDLQIGNIDPGHIADDKGNRYLYFSSGGYVPLAADGLSVTGPMQHVYDGWSIPRKWSIECFCMEGPKLFRRGDYYYLTVAQGGTAGPGTGHMVISARSKSPVGPWENSPFNPIIRAQVNTQKWLSVGHATPFQDRSNKWWMVLHGYENGYYNMGRQTLLAPLEWTADGWFKLPAGFDINAALRLPPASSRSFIANDDFTGSSLHPQWKFFGGYDPNRFSCTNDGILIKAKGNAIPESAPLLCMPSDHSYTVNVELETSGNAIGGLVLYYSHKAYSGILADSSNILANLRGWQFPTEKNVVAGRAFLRLTNNNNIVDMYYSTNGKDWIKIENSADVSAYHHNVLSDFLGLRIGLVAMGEGTVKFKAFRYEAIK